MIERKFRLPSSIKFRFPLIVSEKEFIIKAQKNTVFFNRFGFVVGKSVDKLATVRNNLKRSFRDHVEKHWLKRQGEFDILFVLKPASKISAKDEVYQKIDSALRKVGLL